MLGSSQTSDTWLPSPLLSCDALLVDEHTPLLGYPTWYRWKNWKRHLENPLPISASQLLHRKNSKVSRLMKQRILSLQNNKDMRIFLTAEFSPWVFFSPSTSRSSCGCTYSGPGCFSRTDSFLLKKPLHRTRSSLVVVCVYIGFRDKRLSRRLGGNPAFLDDLPSYDSTNFVFYIA